MSLIDKLKSYFSKNKDKDDELVLSEDQKIANVYNQIIDILCDYEDEYFQYIKHEMKILNGHKHQRVKDYEDKLLELIEENPKVLSVFNNQDETIGMQACRLGLESVAARAVEDEDSNEYYNARQNHLGHYAATYSMKEPLLKWIENDKLRNLTDDEGNTAADYFFIEKGFNDFSENDRNEIIDAMFKHDDIFLHQDEKQKIIPMKMAYAGMSDLILRSMDIDGVVTHRDFQDRSIGFYCANYMLEDCVIKALDNKEACEQVDMFGYNIGMFAAFNHLERATIKAMGNVVTRYQHNSDNKSILDEAYSIDLETATYYGIKLELQDGKKLNSSLQWYYDNLTLPENSSKVQELEKDLTEILDSFKENEKVDNSEQSQM